MNTESTGHEQQPWTVAANSLSYDEISLLDLNVGDIEKLVRQACIAYADDQIGALREARREIGRLRTALEDCERMLRLSPALDSIIKLHNEAIKNAQNALAEIK